MKISKIRAAHATRKLAGQEIPRENSTSFGMRNALKRARGGACMMGEVGGESAKPNLAKPGIKRASGGWIGEGDSGKRLREKAKEVRDEPAFGKALLGNVGQAASAALMGRRRGPGLGAAALAGTTAYAGKKYYDSLTQDTRAKALEDEADKAEGRKFGGRLRFKSKKSRDASDDDEDC